MMGIMATSSRGGRLWRADRRAIQDPYGGAGILGGMRVLVVEDEQPPAGYIAVGPRKTVTGVGYRIS